MSRANFTKRLAVGLACLTLLVPGLLGTKLVSAETIYKFPWEDGTSWEWGDRYGLPWHNTAGHCSAGMYCMDFFTRSTDNDTVLSIAAGTIDEVCFGNLTADIYINHGGNRFIYRHFDKNTLKPGIADGATIQQGTPLGEVYFNDFTDTTVCRNSSSGVGGDQDNSGHLHLESPFPTTNFEGWKFTHGSSTATFTDGTLRSTNSYFTSSNRLNQRGKTDFNNNGLGDILWRAKDDTSMTFWSFMADGNKTSVGLGGTDPNWKVVGTGDFNADGYTDILWRSKDNIGMAYWALLPNGNKTSVGLGSTDPNWKVASIGDYNGDGYSDILWRKNDDTSMTYWAMLPNGSRTSVNLGATDPNWRVIGSANFLNNGRSQILWRTKTDLSLAYWDVTPSNGNQSYFLGSTDSTWKINGLGDFDGDGKDDILWRSKTDIGTAYWKVDGTNRTSVGLMNTDSNWKIEGVNDLTGDGRDDIIWRKKDDTSMTLWVMNGGIVGNLSLGSTSVSAKTLASEINN